MARSNFDNMAGHHDMQVRDIYGAIDDRSLDEIAEGIMEVHQNYDRAFEGAEEFRKKWPQLWDRQSLTEKEADDSTVLASQIVDWANYATAYNDYSNPPWERAGNPGNPDKATRQLKNKLLR